MSDLVDRLRDERHCNHTYLRNEAADEIERLTAERDALKQDAARWRMANRLRLVTAEHIDRAMKEDK